MCGEMKNPTRQIQFHTTNNMGNTAKTMQRDDAPESCLKCDESNYIGGRYSAASPQ